MKDFLDLNNQVDGGVGMEEPFQPLSEESLNTKLAGWYGEEKLLMSNKSDTDALEFPYPRNDSGVIAKRPIAVKFANVIEKSLYVVKGIRP